MVQWYSRSDNAEPPVLDLAYLQRLATHIGEREARELMADALLELTDRLDHLHRLTERGTIDEIGRLAHDIAGMAGHQGLSALSLAAVDVARRSREDPDSSAMDLADQVLKHRPMALAAMADYCTGRTGSESHA